jgi:hypothetical protein
VRGERCYRPRITNEATWRQDGTRIGGFDQNRGEENIGINQDSPITNDELITRFSGREDNDHFEEVAWWCRCICKHHVARNGAQILRRSELSSFIVCGNVAEAKRQQVGVLSYHTIVIRRVVFID